LRDAREPARAKAVRVREAPGNEGSLREERGILSRKKLATSFAVNGSKPRAETVAWEPRGPSRATGNDCGPRGAVKNAERHEFNLPQ
jgi:hypothetical protein